MIFETLLLLALAGTGSGVVVVQDEEALSPQQEMLEKAIKRYEWGRYKDAWYAYRDLARKHPDSDEGRLAARRCRESGFLGSTLILDNGPSSNRFDVAIMGDGYQLKKQKGFDKLADDVPKMFERQRTFEEYLGYFNFHRVNLVSKDDGLSGHGRVKDTALKGHVADTYAGHANVDRKRVFEMLGEMEQHDSMAIVYVKAGAMGMGSSGVATIGGRGEGTTVHEFGHAFARLGDEYTKNTHERGKVGNRPNVSNTEDEEKVPWAHWLAAKVPGVGVYQGAAGQERGAWKPSASGCVMQSGNFFCRPCREALVLRIYNVVDPIDEVAPPAHRADTRELYLLDAPRRFDVRVMTPHSHRLEVRWYLFRDTEAPRSPELRPGQTDRRKRGPLPAIERKPEQLMRNSKTGEYSLTLSPADLEPGRYKLVVRVIDTTKPRGERWPWVLKDERGLLESERGWFVVVPGER